MHSRSPFFSAAPVRPEPGVGEGAEERAKKNLTPRTLSRCATGEALACLPYEQSAALKALPLAIMGVGPKRVLAVAGTPGVEIECSAALRFATGYEIKFVAVSEEVLVPAIFAAYHRDAASLTKHADRLSQSRAAPQVGPRAEIPFKPPSGEAAQFLAALIEHALAIGASDLHVVPRIDGSTVRVRVDGSLRAHDGPVCSLAVHAQVIGRLKILAGLDITQRSAPQDGAFSVPAAGRPIRARVSVMPTLHGEKAVVRFLGQERILRIDDLGFEPRIRELLYREMSRGEGAVLFAGATGSGKTTTMYAMMTELAARSESVVSIEDPVELDLDGVSQTNVDGAHGQTFASCLRSMLRQDPDVIMVGEIRDEESASTAFQAALTGHLILSTVHARSAGEVMLRLSHLKVDPLTVNQALRLVVCQKLLPRLCGCKVIDIASSNAFHGDVFRSVGCARCDYSGYDGRLMVAEARSVVGAAETVTIEESLRGSLFAGDISAAQYREETAARAGEDMVSPRGEPSP